MKHYTLTTQPAREPITAQEAADFLRIACSTDDLAALTGFVSAAREAVENFTGRALMVEGWKMVTDGWCSGVLMLDRSPLVAASAVKYYADGQTSLTTLDPGSYVVITGTTPGRVQITADLPALADRADAVQVDFTAGVTDPGAIPPTLMHAVRLLVAHFYELRTPVNVGNIVNELPLGLRHLLESQRVGGWVG